MFLFFTAKRFELSECSNDVVALISHAVEDRLKTLVEKLGVIAEHRQEQLKVRKCCFVENSTRQMFDFIEQSKLRNHTRC